MISISRILCPVDFSEFSGRAVDHAVGIARWYGSGTTALYVLPAIPAFGPPAGEGLYPPMAYSPRDLQQFRDELQAFAGAHGVAALDTEVVQGSVTGEILRFAADLPADMQDRITYRAGERYDRLREWLLDAAADADLPLDHLFSRLFGEVLSQPGFGFHDDPEAGPARLYYVTVTIRTWLTGWRHLG